MAYRLTIHIAELGSNHPHGFLGKSRVGHVWYEIEDTSTGLTKSYGYTPDGVVIDDTKQYTSSWGGDVHSMTTDIMKSEFDKLYDFGENSENYGYPNNGYDVLGHNCIQYTLEALHQAGLDVVGINRSFLPGNNLDTFEEIFKKYHDSRSWIDSGDECLAPWHKDASKYRQNKFHQYDPLILDLGGNGIETISVAGFSGSLFDHNNDGIRTATGWISADDGLLVRDLNGNGLIDNGSELFGNNTRLANGQNAAHGYAALAELDSNNDGKINALDKAFNELRVWIDANSDGISQVSELHTLMSLDIQSLNLEHQENSKDLGNGNRLTHIGSYTKTDGTTGEMGDVEFASNSLYSRYTDTVELTPEQLKAPNLQGLGRLRDLINSFDISGSLKAD